jgi:hypothetical protein
MTAQRRRSRAPAGGEEPAATEVSLYQQALTLQQQGVSRDDIRTQLLARGLEAESVGVVLNSLPNAPMPPLLPEAHLELGINPLAPNTVAVSDLGMSGDPRVVGLYWLTFGVVLTLLCGVVLWVNEAKLTDASAGLYGFFAKIGIFLGAVATVFGFYRAWRRGQ